jgi:NAD(P)-dependent dehydrogenase (short-subunit alcohol dehydrogenase family)
MIQNPLDMKGALVLVTGASSGIGRETAIVLSQLNARLVITGRDQARLAQTLEQLEGTGHRVEPFDLENTDAIPKWLRTIVDRTGPLSGLAHCGGLIHLLPVQYLSTAKFETLMRTNVTSAVMLVKAFRARGCAVRGSGVVLLSSMAAFDGDAGLSAYAAGKAALIGFARSAARELVADGLRVNCVAPAIIKGELLDRVGQDTGPEHVERLRQRHPMGFGEPRDVAYAIAYLLAETGRWITGSTLEIDGGYSLR